mmetsp:Transcript_5510/g.12231  ORF Transcript_5510/g.12231 Transcript_5510/m.12231 type:complete len:208 (+) Transcript_5510:79-702(+)
MGNTPSLHDQLIDVKLNVKTLERAEKKCQKNRTKQLASVKKAIKEGNVEGARIYAENAIREKQQGLNYLKLASRLDAVASRIETAITTQEISKSMGTVVQTMNSALESMDVEKISQTMSQFEAEFENMEVVTGTMQSTMDSATSSQMPGDQVDDLILQVADQHNLEVGAMLDDAGVVGAGTVGTRQAVEQKEDRAAMMSAAIPAAPG